MSIRYDNFKEFSTLKGKTIVSVDGLEKGGAEVVFKCSDGTSYMMYHEQDCCESVWIEDIYGDADCLIGTPVLLADERTNIDAPKLENSDDSFTWTFYTLATIKGYVDIRWYGTSNGYYSEGVDFREVPA